MVQKKEGAATPRAERKQRALRLSNRIRQLRTDLKLSQRALATKVGVSQQHIQRLETSNDIDVGFVLATKLCEVLGQPLDVVFPRTKKVMSRLPFVEDGRRRSIDPLFYDRGTKKEIERAGIDMDVTPWFIQMKLRGRAETVDVLLGDGEYSRLWRLLQSERPPEEFIVFEGVDGCRYAVQPKHLLSWHFRFDTVDLGRFQKGHPDENSHGAEVPDETIRIWYSDGTPVVELDGEPDEPSEFHDIGPLDYIFSMLELSNEGCYSFVDSAGEPFWFRAIDVALFAAPNHLIGEEGLEVEEEMKD